jgi:ABC-type transport system involved in cytochrome c biogenesis permease subunit
MSTAVLPMPPPAPLPAPVEARRFPWGVVGAAGAVALFVLLLAIRRVLGGVDQWMFPILTTATSCYAGAMVLYLLALRFKTMRLATGALLLGFVASAFLVTTRGLEAGRWPSQSKFEVFFNTSMTVAASMLLLTWAFGLAAARGRAKAGAALVGVVISGFAMMWTLIARKEDFDIQELPPALQSLWFPPHVSSYMLSYSGVFAAALVAAVHLAVVWRAKVTAAATGAGSLAGDLDTFVYRIVTVAFPLLTSGLFLGALWGEAAWADYWFWDIKETWAFISWLVLLGYLHLRMIAGWSGWKMSLFILLGAAAIGVTYVGVQLLPASIASEHVYN